MPAKHEKGKAETGREGAEHGEEFVVASTAYST